MKKIFLMAFFMPVLAYGQIVETFEQGSLSGWVQGTAGHWGADSTGCITGKFSMHHVFDSPSSGTDCTGLLLADLHPEAGVTTWEFKIRHGYDPSASNNWSVYLLTNSDPSSFQTGASANGFAVGVNLTGYDDTLRLWKAVNGSVSVVLTTSVNWQNDIGTGKWARVKAERSPEGLWRISVYDSANNLLDSAAGNDDRLFSPYWFIVVYRYSSTRDRLLWFDDVMIDGHFYRDTIPPEVIDLRVTGRNELQLVLSEELSEFVPDNSANEVTEIKCISYTYYLLRFRDEFANKKENILTIRLLCDKQGNCTTDYKVKFTPAWAEAGDVIISEIMADPLPVVGLPGKEYFEITNRGSFSFCLQGWKYFAGDQKISIPAYDIGPGEYVIICSATDTALFSKYGRTIGLKPFPVLSDGGKLIYITDSLFNLIHGVDYSQQWYGNALKEKGGWALEMIDMNFPFHAEGNWEASNSSRGGTPGKANSVDRINLDNGFQGIMNCFPDDSITIVLQLSETVFDLVGQPALITVDNNPVLSVAHDDPLLRSFILKSSERFLPEKVYNLQLSGEVTDAAGNLPERSSYLFGVPEKTAKGDIVFNELMFNPLPGDPDYIELYNCSEKTIDASRLLLASVSETGDTSVTFYVSDMPRCIIPGSFYAVTTDPEKINDRYYSSDSEHIYYAGTLPSMPDDRGHLLLLNRELEVIDEVIYSEDQHYSLIAENEGIALEKIRPGASSGESANWHSASGSSGWGTPGRENSVFSRLPQADDQIIFSSGRISPDNDGFEDFLVIDMNLEGNDNVVTVTVFDETGQFVDRIAENILAGSNATIVWDATYKSGQLVREGIYIILIELFSDKGKKKSWKKVCTVLR